MLELVEGIIQGGKYKPKAQNLTFWYSCHLCCDKAHQDSHLLLHNTMVHYGTLPLLLTERCLTKDHSLKEIFSQDWHLISILTEVRSILLNFDMLECLNCVLSIPYKIRRIFLLPKFVGKWLENLPKCDDPLPFLKAHAVLSI